MPHHPAVPALLLTGIAVIAPAQDPAAAEAAFEQGLDRVRALMAKAKWSEARQALQGLLTAQPRAPVAHASSATIIDLMTDCCFHEQVKVPSARDLLTGKIQAFDERTGRVSIRWTQLDGWEAMGELMMCPLHFAGSYSVTLAGKVYPTTSLGMLVDYQPTDGSHHFVDFGFGQIAVQGGSAAIPAGIGSHKDSRNAPPSSTTSPARVGKPYSMTVRVTPDEIELRSGNRPVLKHKRARTPLGHVLVWITKYDYVEVEGQIEMSLLQNRIDEQIALQREAFLAGFDPMRELPSWLAERPSATPTQALPTAPLPEAGDLVSNAVADILHLMDQGKLGEARTAIDALTEQHAAPALKLWLSASEFLRAGRPEHALPVAARLMTLCPDNTIATVIHARALEQTGRCDEALAALQRAQQRDPGQIECYEPLCLLLLRDGRLDEARRLLREAKTRHGMWDELAGQDRLLAMAERGPAWPRRHSCRSTHYEVHSDIDRAICAEACRILEESYTNLMGQLDWIQEDPKRPRLRVFLFAGEAGYQEYCRAILGAPVPHTAGLYSPVLKQLLIWNLPKREDMYRTIRHEGFHQFLDASIPEPPVWFNEGMAEFWETAQREQGRVQGGQVRREHMATLVRSRKSLPKLQKLVYGDRADFYGNASLRYPHAWALVHFLRKGPREVTPRFDRLWQELQKPQGHRAALEAAFAGVDWDRFDDEFWAYLGKLR